MNDVITTTSTRPVRSDSSTALPVDTRIRVVRIEGSSALQEYVGSIGTIVSHAAVTAPLVKFDMSRSGDDKWYVVEWSTLPTPGQRVTVTGCQQFASEEFKDWATGREGTYLSTDSQGIHLVQFDDTPSVRDFPNPAAVAHLDFVLGAEVPVEAESTRSGPVLIVDTAASVEERDREARRKYDALVEAINDMAEREEWCGSFEEWAEENGVEVRRSRDIEYTVSIDLTYEIDADTVASWLRREYGGSHDDVDTSDVSITSSVNITMTIGGGDNPHDVDSWTVESALSDHNYSGWSNWEITDYDQN